MKNISREESGWILARVWLDALESTGRDFGGKKPLIYIERAYEHATTFLLRILEKEYGLKTKKTSTMEEAISHYIEMGIKGGLFQDKNQFEIKQLTPYKLDIKIHKCPYFSSCQDLIEDEGISVSDLTCARIGCFKSAIKLLSNMECIYSVNSIDEEKGCSGMIAKK